MSFTAMDVAYRHSKATGMAKLVLLGITHHLGEMGSWPSVNTLAAENGIGRATVQRALNRLEELGEVRRHIQKGRVRGAKGPTNQYEFMLRCPNGCQHKSHIKEGFTIPLRVMEQLDPSPVSEGEIFEAEVADGIEHPAPRLAPQNETPHARAQHSEAQPDCLRAGSTLDRSEALISDLINTPSLEVRSNTHLSKEEVSVDRSDAHLSKGTQPNQQPPSITAQKNTSANHDADARQPAELQHPTGRATWRPSEHAIKTAKSVDCEAYCDINIHIARYITVKAEKGEKPSHAEWLRWYLADAQQEKRKYLADQRKSEQASSGGMPAWVGVDN